MERIEQKIKKSGQRSRIQQKIALAIFRMTTQSSSLAFASDALLRKRLGFESGTPAARMSQALHRLQKIGFVRIQDSVWAYPYDCEEVLAFIRTELRLGGGVLYLIAEGIEHDRSLRAKFDLLP